MVKKARELIEIDLDQFKLRLKIKDKTELSLHFDSPSRRFYISVIALVVSEMKRLGKLTSIPLEHHYDLIALLNETVGGSAGSSERKSLLPRIYMKWKGALSDLEHAPLFNVLGKRKEYEDAIGKVYRFTEEEKDIWANLFEYKGSHDKVRLRFSVDKLGVGLDDVVITYGEGENLSDVTAWERYVDSLKEQMKDKIEVALNPIEKPSIAVLPFVNISGYPEQEYFVDGITNDIITALFEFKNLFVIASNSSFAYKGKPVKVQEVSQDLGVRYVLEGSIQRTGDRMRINTQLIDATTGKHLWAERYDRDAQQLFDIQDEIVETIVATLAFKVDATERERVMRKGPKNLDAYDYWLRGRNAWFRWTKEANTQARHLFEKAIELEPNWGRPYGYMAWVHVNDSRYGWSEDPEKSMEFAMKTARKAYELNPDDYETRWTLGFVYLYLRDFDRAIAEYERALELNSNDADFLAEMAIGLNYMGRSEQAISQVKKAMRMNPRHPSWYWWNLGLAYYEVGRYKEALATLKQENNPFFLVHRNLAAVYVRLGQLEEARVEVSKLLKKNPHYTLKMENLRPYKDSAQRDRFINDLRKAGVPE